MDPLILLKFTERIEVPRKFAAIGYDHIDKNVLVAVVVIVGYGYSHAVSDPFKTGLLRDVFKSAIRFLSIHPIPIFRTGLLRNRPLGFRV
jgi:hypothetical protein